jgi:GH43 family beta-xylosidase
MPSFAAYPQRSARALSPRADCLRAGRAGRSLCLERLESRIALAGDGLTAQYFHNSDFTGLAVERTEAVDFAWGTLSPVAGMDANTFSVRWTGQVEAEFSETYTFRTVSDNGVRLWVDGQLLIDNWTSHAVQTNSGTIALEAGRRYDVRLDYFENTGAAEIRLRWESASQPSEAVPASQLYASPEGVRGEYSDGFGGSGMRIDPVLDFNWATGRPISTVAVDNFRVRWTGLVRPEHSEQYTFSTLSDEGVRVWIGDELVIDHWSPHTATARTGSKVLEAGKWYDLRVEYFDVSGNAEVELAWAGEAQTSGQFEIIASENLRAARHTPLFATNPLGPGQDPFVIKWEDSYLHVHSVGTSVWIEKADQLQDVQKDDSDATSVRAWRAPVGTNYSAQIWAPELFQIDGKWYIYVAASAGTNETHRMHVLERDDPNPMGSYVYKGQLAATTDRWAIDGTVLEWQDKLYFIWSGWPGFVDGQQNLYIAEMSNPWTISGERVLISSPQYAWEMHGIAVNEGPEVLIHNGQLHIIYSASAYFTDQYALGRLTYNGTGPILSAASWTKAPSPVFQSTSEVVGVGHASFTQSPDGTQHWIVYHSHHDPGPFNDDRDIRIQQFTYFANGTPNFGTPLPANSHVEVPSGEADADRPLLPGDFDANGAVNVLDLNVWKAQVGSEIFPGRAVDGTDFLVWQRQLGATAPVGTISSVAAASDSILATSPNGALSSSTQASANLYETAATADADLGGFAGLSLSMPSGSALSGPAQRDAGRAELADAVFSTSPTVNAYLLRESESPISNGLQSIDRRAAFIEELDAELELYWEFGFTLPTRARQTQTFPWWLDHPAGQGHR